MAFRARCPAATGDSFYIRFAAANDLLLDQAWKFEHCPLWVDRDPCPGFVVSMIYLDANASTPLDPRVIEAMLPFLTTHYANPSAAYSAARVTRDAIAKARGQVAALIDCEPDEIVFMGGGTESNNAAMASALTLDARRT